MKKIIFAIPLLALALASCDPKEVDLGSPDSAISEDALAKGFSFKQWSDETHATAQDDGNYFTFATNPVQPVIVYQLVDGKKSIIGSGSSGSFKIVPKRGQSSEQEFYVAAANHEGQTAVKETANVYVPSELTPEMKLLVSDDGVKIWKWDSDFRIDKGLPAGSWGNMGYAPGDGASFAEQSNGIWWGVGDPGILNTPDQLKNAPDGQPQGDASSKAFMKFYEDGTIETYDSLGNVLRKGKFEMKNYDGTRHVASIDGSQAAWSYGTFHTTAGSIMWPFMINGGGKVLPEDFEVLQLDVNHLKLIYAKEGTGSWGEATWWAFKSESDGIGALTDYSSKSWTWDTEFREDGGAWGNMGYAPGDGDSFATSGNGIWWGCNPQYLENPDKDGNTQMQHSNSTTPLGEGDGAYMTFDWKAGLVTSYTAVGKQIRQGKFEIQNWGNGSRTIASVDGSQNQWALGNLHTDAGSILWPFMINGGGTTPTDFAIMQLDGNHLKLVYAKQGTAAWSEATWWAFKAKK